MNEQLIILCLITAVQIVPYIFLIIMMFKEYLVPKRQYVALIAAIVLVALFLISRFSIPIIESRAWARLVLDTCSALFLSFLLFSLSRFSFAQASYIIFTLTTINDDLKLFALMTLPQADETYAFTWKYVLTLTGSYAVALPLLIVFFRTLFLPMLQRIQQNDFWSYMCITPVVLFFLYRFNIYPGYFNRNFIWYEEMAFTPVIWIVGTILLYYVAFKGLSLMISHIHLERTLRTAEESLSAQKKTFLTIQDAVEADRRLRHDFRHTILAIRSHAAGGDIDGLLSLTDNYINLLNSTKVTTYCEHTSLNAIFSYYAGLAEKKNIPMEICASIPENVIFSEIDLCCLLGNLLENAMEACERQTTGKRSISLKAMTTSESIFSCVVTNTFDGILIQEGDTYLSSKRDHEPGVGLASIRYVVSKYNGVINIDHDESLFSVALMLLTPTKGSK